jgi:hypothetical protein
MAKPKNFGDKSSPLINLYRILCNAVFDDPLGANETTYNVLMILGEAIDKTTAKEIARKVEYRDGRYRYE